MNGEHKWADDYAKEMKNIITMQSDRLVDIADDIGKKLAQDLKLKMNQIRRFLDALRKVEQDYYQLGGSKDQEKRERVRHNLAMLRPKLAYAAGREKQVKPLMKILEPAIQATTQDPDKGFEKLLRFMEAIIAYHRYHGGSN